MVGRWNTGNAEWAPVPLTGFGGRWVWEMRGKEGTKETKGWQPQDSPAGCREVRGLGTNRTRVGDGSETGAKGLELLGSLALGELKGGATSAPEPGLRAAGSGGSGLWPVGSPMVEMYVLLKLSSAKRMIRQVLPTPESPISSNLKRWS